MTIQIESTEDRAQRQFKNEWTLRSNLIRMPLFILLFKSKKTNLPEDPRSRG